MKNCSTLKVVPQAGSDSIVVHCNIVMFWKVVYSQRDFKKKKKKNTHPEQRVNANTTD